MTGICKKMDREEIYEKLKILKNYEEKLYEVIDHVDSTLGDIYILLNYMVSYTELLMNEFESNEERIEELKAWKDKYTDFYGGVPK